MREKKGKESRREIGEVRRRERNIIIIRQQCAIHRSTVPLFATGLYAERAVLISSCTHTHTHTHNGVGLIRG